MEPTRCRVRSCNNPIEDIWEFPRYGELHRVLVCPDHYVYLEGGGEWRLTSNDPEGRDIELLVDADDLTSDGLLLMVGVDGGLEVGIASGSWTSRTDYVATLTLDAALWGQEASPRPVRILITREQAQQLSGELGAIDLLAPDDRP